MADINVPSGSNIPYVPRIADMDPQELQQMLARQRMFDTQNSTMPPASSSVLLQELLGGQGNTMGPRQPMNFMPQMQQPRYYPVPQQPMPQPAQPMQQQPMMFGGMSMNPGQQDNPYFPQNRQVGRAQRGG